jgi:alpha-tubulin suppressor-like RCC1 family protein
MRPLRGGTLLAWAGVLLTCWAGTGCKGDRDEQESPVSRWLLCEECVDGELESVLRADTRGVVPVLDTALMGMSAVDSANVWHQFAASYARIVEHVGASNVAVTESTYVARLLDNFTATYYARAATALGHIGTPAAVRALQDAVARDSAGEISYRADVLRAIDRALVRAGGVSWQVVRAGRESTCALTSGGDAYCWGLNRRGQLGTGDTLLRWLPAPVIGGYTLQLLNGVGWFRCGLTTAGSTACWGTNGRYQLGRESPPVLIPRPAVLPPNQTTGSSFRFNAVSAGADHTCADSLGQLYCWGDNRYGQGGDNSADLRWAEPRAVDGGHQLRQPDLGALHSCALAADTAYCWGRNQFGMLGDSTTTDRRRPSLVSRGLSFQTVSAGYQHTCGVTTTGGAFCWGADARGRLGSDPPGTYSPFPVAVVGGITFDSISTGGTHTCALTAAGTAYCWGVNSAGQVGDSSTADRWEPRAVAGGHAFVSVSAGYDHTCAVTTDGDALCWGSNQSGQLGVGEGITMDSVPVPIGNPPQP